MPAYTQNKKIWLISSIVFFLVIFSAGLIFWYGLPLPQETPIDPPATALYLNSDVPIEMRVENLLSYMTLEEKIGQMALVDKNSIITPQDVADYNLGALLSGFGSKPEDNTIEGWKKMVEDFTDTSKRSRLRIPILYGADAIHGHTNVPGATVFPHAIGLGATGDADLVERVAAATAKEMAATGISWSYSPNLDLPQDIRWGRVYETFSDDPNLTATLGAAYLRGLQTQPSSSVSSNVFVLGTAKHYLGAGGMNWNSSSNKNFKIDQGTTMPDEKFLRETYLPPFKESVESGVLSVMAGLNSWGDTKLAANKELITDLLKEELEFKGFVVSDWYGVYEISSNDYKSAVIAINAGIDMVMLPFDYKAFVKNIKRAVRRGEIDEERIDDAVKRILLAKFSLGLFDEREEIASAVVGSEEHRELAREAVAKSLVLLKNDAATLPLSKNLKRIVVGGSAADNVGRQSGAWTVEWQGVDGNWLPNSSSILDGIKETVSSNTVVDYDLLGHFSKTGELADVGIAVVGETPYAEGWGDKEYPILSNEDLETIKNLQKISKKVVVIIISGRPLLTTNEIPTWNALVAAWLPGSEGKAIAPLLFGDKEFTGKLPLPWPETSQQLPIRPDGITADGTKVLFHRGFGLPY